MKLYRINVLAISLSALTFLPTANASDGKAVYDSTCKMCHTAGIAGAPKLGDKAQWADRLAKGTAALEKSAIDGIGIMPARGANAKLSDDDVKAAVAYMLASVK